MSGVTAVVRGYHLHGIDSNSEHPQQRDQREGAEAAAYAYQRNGGHRNPGALENLLLDETAIGAIGSAHEPVRGSGPAAGFAAGPEGAQGVLEGAQAVLEGAQAVSVFGGKQHARWFAHQGNATPRSVYCT
jgi:hypothetical protein